MRMIEVTLPVSCAPYLINGDDSDGRAVYEADRVCANVNINPLHVSQSAMSGSRVGMACSLRSQPSRSTPT